MDLPIVASLEALQQGSLLVGPLLLPFLESLGILVILFEILSVPMIPFLKSLRIPSIPCGESLGSLRIPMIPLKSSFLSRLASDVPF